MLLVNLFKCGTFGVIGTALGLAYQSYNSNITDQSDLKELTVPYTYLQYDIQLISLLKEIEKTLRAVDLIAYVRIVSIIDNIVGLKYTVETNGGELCDRTIAYRLVQRCKESMKRCYIIMEESFKNKESNKLYSPMHHDTKYSLSPRDIIHIQSTCKKIIFILESYLKAIISLTNDDRIKQ